MCVVLFVGVVRVVVVVVVVRVVSCVVFCVYCVCVCVCLCVCWCVRVFMCCVRGGNVATIRSHFGPNPKPYTAFFLKAAC